MVVDREINCVCCSGVVEASLFEKFVISLPSIHVYLDLVHKSPWFECCELCCVKYAWMVLRYVDFMRC
jgi:hypothetical protein